MGTVLCLLGGFAILAGLVFFLAGTVGLLRFPDPLSRLHALTKADSLGLGLVTLGLLPFAGGILPALKMILIWALVLFAGTTVAQLIGERIRRSGPTE